jgi:outer membrane protein assembly factor BamC
LKPRLAARPARASGGVLLAVVVAGGLAGCSSIGEMFAGDTVDYRTGTPKGKPLDVPPDLSQLSRDGRFQPQGGVVSAANTRPNASGTPTAGQPATMATVALNTQGQVRVERQGDTRWLVVPLPPEKVWPQVRAFWQETGFTLSTENAEAGVMETDWAENRAKLPQDAIRSTLGRFIDKLYDSGERDRYRTRVERTAGGGSEIFISHRGLQEVFTNERRDNTSWTPRPSDPELEVKMLTALMVRLGTKEEVARTAVANAPEQPARARVISGGAGAAMEIDEPFDRAWRRVGLALDRSGFSVEDRDRTGGLYFVRYVDPKAATQQEAGFFSRIFSSGPTTTAPVRYRVAVTANGERSTVAVLNSAGAPESGENGQRIVALLVNELK